MFEFSEVMKRPGAMTDWASKVAYGVELSQEDRNINDCMDAWARELGKNGDPKHELSALITRTFTNEEVSAPTE